MADNGNNQDLFSNERLSFFKQYGSSTLIATRNTNIGSLLISERVVYYLNILYRMLLFKRDYELEPLYEDIFQGVYSAQSALTTPPDGDYSQNQFRTDLDQLTKWELVDFRIEKQRLRGYRDNRKRKFRYRLKSEAGAFLEWLEERCLDDMQSRGADTRDLLGETRGSLEELLRLLHSFKNGRDGQEETARRILFQLCKAGDICQEIMVNLADLNGRLLFFLVQHYQINEVRKLIQEIEHYVNNFLKQTYSLRTEITPQLERLQKERNRKKISECHTIMEAERLRTPNLLQSRRSIHIDTIPDKLYTFFEEQGGLDRLLQRINSSSIKVWRRLRSHLRELERKNNRLQDIRYRTGELAALDEDESAAGFMNELLSQPLNCFDPNYWDKTEKAEPPVPRKRLSPKSGFPKQYMATKKSRGKAVESMDEARLKHLRQWIEEKIFPRKGEVTGTLSKAEFTEFDDFSRVIDLARAGLLDNGKRLSRIDYQLDPSEERILLTIVEQQLGCPELTVISTKQSSVKQWK